MTTTTRAALALGLLLATLAPVAGRSSPETTWRTDPAWYAGKAEWALYDAVRPIYGTPRRYEATIFTNKQRMDPATTTKDDGTAGSRGVEVFKHNVSEMIPTEARYTYRFLTTAFVRTDTLGLYKLVMSSQEDCGATYKQLVVEDDRVDARQFCYFPDAGTTQTGYAVRDGLAFHDALSLTLRDYPFDARPEIALTLVPDQTDTHETKLRGAPARVRYVERTTIDVPYGSVDTHHLRVEHAADGGTTTSDYWLAADPAMRHAMVRYAGPYGVEYRLKRLAWWAYWREPRP